MTDDLDKAWERHCDLLNRLGIYDEQILEDSWRVFLALKDIEYPPGPNPEQEKAMIEVGRLVSNAMKT